MGQKAGIVKTDSMSENHFRKLLKQSGIKPANAAGKKLYSVKEIVTYLDHCKD